MVIKELPQIGNPILRKKSKSVSAASIKSQPIKKIIRDLVDTMRAADLVGMAAPQIGVSVKVIAVEVRQTKYRKMPEEPLMILINPKIIWKSKKMITDYEGCGSVLRGKLFGPVQRHESIVVQYFDIGGKKCRIRAKNNKAIIIQHEVDHLDGVLFSDLITDNSKILDYDAYIKLRLEQRKQKEKTI